MILVSNLEARKMQTVFSIWKLKQLTQKNQAKNQEQIKEPEQKLWMIKLLLWKTWHN